MSAMKYAVEIYDRHVFEALALMIQSAARLVAFAEFVGWAASTCVPSLPTTVHEVNRRERSYSGG